MNSKKAKKLRRGVKEEMEKNGQNAKMFRTYYQTIKRLIKVGTALLMICVSTLCYADKIVVPFECYPQKIIQVFKSNGYKLESDGTKRDETSWGFLINEGSRYVIYTYKPVNTDDGDELDTIMELIWQSQV